MSHCIVGCSEERKSQHGWGRWASKPHLNLQCNKGEPMKHRNRGARKKHAKSSIKGRFPMRVVVLQRLSSIKIFLPSKVVIHQNSSSIKGPIPSNVIFHQIVYAIKGNLPSKVVFHQRLSYINGHLPSKDIFIKSCLPSKFIFHQRLSSIKVHLPNGCFLFHQWSSSIEVHLQSKVLFHQRTWIFLYLSRNVCSSKMPKLQDQYLSPSSLTPCS